MYLNSERLSVIFVEGKQLDTVDSFNYLGSCITTEGGAERDIQVRIGKAKSAFVRLGNIWKTTAFSKTNMTDNLSELRYINFVFLALMIRPTILAFSSNFLVFFRMWSSVCDNSAKSTSWIQKR
jgi:hypothetical protein